MIDLLFHINGLLAASVLIVAFSLLAFIALNNWRQDMARALCILLLSVVVVYGGDVLIVRASRLETIQFLLRAQWIGITLAPAAYLHLASALLHASQPDRPYHRWPIWASYTGSVLFFLLTLRTDLVISGGIPTGIVTQVSAGPLFWLYVLLLATSMLLLLSTILQAHHTALTPTLRRRLAYLGATFAAPGLGIFPYLAIADSANLLPQWLILLVAAFVSIGLMVMMTVMAYSVAFQGVPLPERLIKNDFTRWGLYGPLVGLTIILCIQLVPWLERWLGLPRDTLITFVVMMMTVLMPLVISRIRPYLDALIYRQDRAEIEYLRGLPRTTFTRADLRQLMENTLIAVCGALDVETGFVVVPDKNGYTVRALCGSRRAVKVFVADNPLDATMPRLAQQPTRQNGPLPRTSRFQAYGQGRLLPLYGPDSLFLGALGIIVPAGKPAEEVLTASDKPEVVHLIDTLARQIELAITLVEMQQRLFDTLRGMGPEMQSLQRLNTSLEQATPASLSDLDESIAAQPGFPQLVKDALTHYWGGPKLSDSPLLSLRSVRTLLEEQGGNPTRALQAVLRQAITSMRPDEQLDPSAQAWLLYNILELRFLQGRRIRDIANHLAMSESDLYRKQRIAIDEVARQLAMMEQGEQHEPPPKEL